MSTHNRLLRIGPFCYLEIIAIDPEAPPPGRKRWFNLDDAALQAQIAQQPQLVHWVLQVSDAQAAVQASVRLGFDNADAPTRVVTASRAQYTWQISVPDDGVPRLHGLVPTFIQWGDDRPVNHMPMSELQLIQLTLEMPRAELLRHTELLTGLDIEAEPLQGEEADVYRMSARFECPKGIVELLGPSVVSPKAKGFFAALLGR